MCGMDGWSIQVDLGLSSVNVAARAVAVGWYSSRSGIETCRVKQVEAERSQ